jgi:hypothetical protein
MIQKVEKRRGMTARLSFNTACELGFRGSLDEWERLMGAVENCVSNRTHKGFELLRRIATRWKERRYCADLIGRNLEVARLGAGPTTAKKLHPDLGLGTAMKLSVKRPHPR